MLWETHYYLELQKYPPLRHVALKARFIGPEKFLKILYTSPWAGSYAMEK
jgi:hypothetical protein